ncbi:MAG: isopentenyl-diphosphate delta-isomerase [Candidatus Huberarchaeum crystalense]|uniref:isopentenyl-diphosphate Delta-isomerase n=1 Tax=Huberarchaeum crystalense TaxID=2014257 RepID=A0A2G9LJ44_HUBC1|nr:MAG: isopentenyl-diphosphate delta-isomerase [archaeon CG2_30_31_98]PIN66534.1 MAG: isopentenyl-diphosphate delta-isomerase [Candidatus Huberarchaeum crystalense]PIV46318.1 MAG: isopentenyl-diphosphate delta-isomerase [Candidatus Huberarchaeum crystalense]PIV89913.1 MAG: isopentenyl-diphosphate delta-isomerase [Candidatus Huberarchaeum crystalense]PIX28022.1 MAG: isopentenyl-diphosphate delta-isomerase [Candidatus Huberarchaeum crystalense]
MPEMIILVDEKDREIGEIEKIEAHKNGGKLHRAFSIFIFNSSNEIMLQRRALTKHHWAGVWSNTCCSHPLIKEKLENAVHRRLKKEMGFDCILKEAFSLVYKATDKETDLTEWEYDHFFIGVFDGAPKLNPKEVKEWKWIKINELKDDLKKNPKKYTPWFKIGLNKVVENL